jgi:hypothetical protein
MGYQTVVTLPRCEPSARCSSRSSSPSAGSAALAATSGDKTGPSVPINGVQTAPLTKIRERFYGFRLVVEVPEVLQMPLVGVPSSVLNFAVTVSGTTRHKGGRRGYIETSLCPPGAQVPLLGTFTFRDRTARQDNTSIVCGGQLP